MQQWFFIQQQTREIMAANDEEKAISSQDENKVCKL